MQRRTVLRWAMTCVLAGVVAVGVAGAQGRRLYLLQYSDCL